ncbi:hypothetical protein CS0771_09830 [Catellatospora sp. IY07-71]|uniref:hypothetical protein n=1 Tax=Catellatospora sp. IY07-71 TaxID=2728827 RepID=UPI001BB4F455|nr:hypothetical protein [Catellatospora sp. IY07-71]BCJ71439.1 hypothetical protein CS0771_09830 [Catellatospora sp. IY07-71]
MAERDPFAARFDDLAAASAAASPPPGIPALITRVRRRRARRAAVLAVAAVLLVSPFTLWKPFDTTPHPVATATPGTSASPSASPSPSATAQPQQPIASPSRTSPSGSPKPRPSKSPAAARTCTPNVYGDVGEVSVAEDEMWASPACANATVRFFWVTYRTAADGTRVKYRSVSYTLSHAKPSVSFSPLQPPEGCGYSEHVVRGSLSVPATLPTSVTYGNAGSYWSGRGGVMLGRYFSSECPEA